MTSDLARAIDSLVKEKGISKEVLVDALEKSILAAARKKFGAHMDIEAQFNNELGEVELFEFRTVVDEIEDEDTEILVDEAHALDPEALPGDSLGMKMNMDDFGRIAAQTAKQVLLQHMRDAEREHIFDEYKDRKDELITGTVRRFERGALIIDLGRTEGVLPSREQMPTESYRPGDRIQAYVLDVLRTARGPQIIFSRTHPGLIKKLFEIEVPEIFEGVVRIEAAVREAGFRAKIAVTSSDADVDPVGACVGLKGSRVQAVVQELRGEKIDIIPWSYDPARFVCNAIAPAIVTKVIVDEETRTMELIVPDDQLSLAIGRRGQNVRLAAQLTGWKLDIVSETKLADLNSRARAEIALLKDLGDTYKEIIIRHGYRSVEDIADAEVEELTEILGVDVDKATEIVRMAEDLLDIWAFKEMKERGADITNVEARLRERGLDVDNLPESPEEILAKLQAEKAAIAAEEAEAARIASEADAIRRDSLFSSLDNKENYEDEYFGGGESATLIDLGDGVGNQAEAAPEGAVSPEADAAPDMEEAPKPTVAEAASTELEAEDEGGAIR